MSESGAHQFRWGQEDTVGENSERAGKGSEVVKPDEKENVILVKINIYRKYKMKCYS